MDRDVQEGCRPQFFLIDDQDEIDSFSDLNSLVDELRKLGIRRTEIHL